VADLKTIAELQEQVKQLEMKKEQAKGRVAQLLTTLKEQYSCTTLKQAKSVLKRKKTELKTLEKEYSELLENFLEKWEEKLL